jgi:NCS2 family nucleobase:cation symporter-2
VVERAVSALVEAYELVSGEELADGPVTIDATFDEFNLNLAVRYRGRLPEKETVSAGAPAVPLAERSVATLASVLLYRLADRVRMKSSGANCEMELHFEH